MEKIKVLALGHIPTWAGGKQESGAANVIYNLAYAMSHDERFKVTLASTDLYVNEIKREKLKLKGWDKKSLLIHMILHPLMSFMFCLKILFAKCKYGSVVCFCGMFFKGIFLHKCYVEESPNIVHLHGADSIIYQYIIPKHIKILITIHGIFGQNSEIENYKSLSKIENDISKSKRIDRLVFISNDLKCQYLQAYGHFIPKVEVIINAYDSNNFFYIQPEKHSKLTLATIASFSENKGQKRVIEAISLSNVDVKYICIGSCSLKQEKEYEKLARELNVDYEYYGKLPPSLIRETLKKVDYMILPSITEGFGLVFLESIACGVPVVIPKDLPIVKEKGIIKPLQNAVLLDDCSINAIRKAIPKLNSMSFSHEVVSASIDSLSWKRIGIFYNKSCLTILEETNGI